MQAGSAGEIGQKLVDRKCHESASRLPGYNPGLASQAPRDQVRPIKDQLPAQTGLLFYKEIQLLLIFIML